MPLQFWFEYGSTYTYLSVARIESVIHDRCVIVEWRPFLLMPILIEQGMDRGPFSPYPAKMRYMWRDVERRARRHGISYSKPSTYPPNSLLTARIGRLAQEQGWCGEFTNEVFRRHWVDDVIIGTDENISSALRSLGKDVKSTIASALSDENKNALRYQTEEAKQLGIFGSPTFVVGHEIFWGDDRLEEAVDFLQHQ